VTRVGDRLTANGEAYWPGKSIMPANEGEFSGTAAPSGRRLHFAADAPDPCVVDLTLAGEFLFANDNRMCGGHNVAFSGIFIRRPSIPNRGAKRDLLRLVFDPVRAQRPEVHRLFRRRCFLAHGAHRRGSRMLL